MRWPRLPGASWHSPRRPRSRADLAREWHVVRVTRQKATAGERKRNADLRKYWSPVTESNRRPSPYHLGATRSITVVGAVHRTLAVAWGWCRMARLLHFAAALRRSRGY